MPRPLRVFLCHASQDKPAVRRLHRYLKQHGIEPWLDEIDLLPGENWEVEIPRALNNSDVILVCLSKNSINKEGYVQKEISFALDKALEKPEGTIFIIPAKLEDCEVPKRLNHYQWVDLFRPDSNKRLLLGLNKRVASLGSDVLPVVLEDTRQRKSHPKPIDISQIDRDTQEKIVAKADQELIEEALREKLERETAEQAEADRVAREAKEKTDREEAERIALAKLEREITEKAETERLSREAREKSAREKSDREAQKQEMPVAKPAPVVERKQDRRTTMPPSSANLRWLGVGGVVLVALLLGGFGLNYLINNLPDATSTISSPKATETPESQTSTSVPFTSTPKPTKTPIPTPTIGLGSTMISEKDNMVLVYVPAGEFVMGSGDGEADEKPIHTVDLDAFWIDQTEVTNAMYAMCVSDGLCKEPTNTSSYTHSSYYDNPEFDDYPVLYVNWNMANVYCSWAGRRLPTEAEWEKATRGTDGNIYPWGNDFDGTRLNFCDKNCTFGWADKSSNDGYADVAPVGSYLSGQSIYGALDMAGNVWEWVNDWYDENYYANSPTTNPTGPNLLDGQYRVLRGGSWGGNNDDDNRSANRYRNDPSNAYHYIGFRCSRSP